MVVILRVETNTRNLPIHNMVFIDASDVTCDCIMMITILAAAIRV